MISPSAMQSRNVNSLFTETHLFAWYVKLNTSSVCLRPGS